jgi:hypothetical protein
MNLYIIGVNHFNPSHRVKLHEIYKEIYRLCNSQPLFIALEYDENFAKEVVKQRDYFKQICTIEWNSLSEQELKTFAESLIYEVDTHIDVFPSVRILWLDNGRIMCEKYAEKRLNIYKAAIKNTNPGKSIMERIILYLKNIAVPFEPSERDSAFAQTIQTTLKSVSPNRNTNYGIVVVGANHASNNNSSMRNLLEKANIKCTVYEL